MTTIAVINPADSPEQYDRALLAGNTPTPGVVKIEGANRAVEWEKKKAKGSSGATVTAQGREPAEPTMKVFLWRDHDAQINHFDLWYSTVLPLLKGALEGKTAIDIYHPALADNDIKSVVVQEIGQLLPEDETGLYSVSVKLLEYSPPKKSGGTPGKSKYTPYVPTEEDQAYEDYLQDLADYQNKIQDDAEDVFQAYKDAGFLPDDFDPGFEDALPEDFA